MVGFGLCYGGAINPVFFSDYYKNALNRSNGIDLTDVAAKPGQCAAWPGPYVRWAAVRGNAIAGLAASSPTTCGAINAANPGTSDVLVERNTFECPPGGRGGGVNVKAAHAVVQAPQLVPAAAARALRPACSVLDFGAVGDNATECTAAAAAAIAACLTVVFPAPGVFLLRPVKLDAHENLTLVIEPGATLAAWPDVDSWNATTGAVRPLLWSDGFVPCGDGALALCPAPLAGFTLTGGGTIDGAGWRWWPFLKTRPRPILLDVARSERLLVRNVTLIDSPSFHIQVRGADIEIADVTIRAGGCHGWLAAPNTDGINIGGQRIHVHDCRVHNGDDCVPTNVGFNNSDTDDVLVERVTCECGTNGGVPIIAGAASIRNVLYRDMVVTNSNQGAGAKISEAWETPTGTFANITWRNITIVNPRYAAVYVNTLQEDSQAKQCAVPVNASRPARWLTAKNLSFIDIAATLNSSAGAYAGCFACTPTSPCTGLLFDGVVVKDVAPYSPAQPMWRCFNAEFNAAASTPKPCAER
jgi:hypothetical protein